MSETYVLMTGPITGNVTLDDGTPVDVTPPMLTFDSQSEVDAVAAAIERRLQSEGVI